MYGWVSCLHVCIPTTYMLGACQKQGQKRMLDPLNLELGTVMRHKATTDINSWAIAPTPIFFKLKQKLSRRFRGYPRHPLIPLAASPRKWHVLQSISQHWHTIIIWAHGSHGSYAFSDYFWKHIVYGLDTSYYLTSIWHALGTWLYGRDSCHNLTQGRFIALTSLTCFHLLPPLLPPQQPTITILPFPITLPAALPFRLEAAFSDLHLGFSPVFRGLSGTYHFHPWIVFHNLYVPQCSRLHLAGHPCWLSPGWKLQISEDTKVKKAAMHIHVLVTRTISASNSLGQLLQIMVTWFCFCECGSGTWASHTLDKPWAGSQLYLGDLFRMTLAISRAHWSVLGRQRLCLAFLYLRDIYVIGP